MSDAQLWLMFASNLIVIIAGASKGISVLLSVRDELRALQVAIVGSKETGPGIIGDILQLQKEQQAMHDWMLQASGEMHIKPPSR